MSEFKGTPGPWSQDEYGNVVHGSKNGFSRMEKVRVSGVTLPGRVTQEYAANTRLVVAAPELLEALQDIMNLQTRGFVILGEKISEKAAKAIEKALGVGDE